MVLCTFFSIQSLAELNIETSRENRVLEIEEVQKETSEILKRQLADQHFDQRSKGFIEVKAGISHFKPKDFEDENDDLFQSLNGRASWESFNYAGLFEIQLGKPFLDSSMNTAVVSHELGIGYQHFRSSLEGDYTPSCSSNPCPSDVEIHESATLHTLFARYTMLFELRNNGKVQFGPGVTIGYSPISEVKIDIVQDDEGIQISAEGTSFLFEGFVKAKAELSRYFSLVGTFGYRVQEVENLRLNAADLVSVATRTDLDTSGFFSMLGIAVDF